MFILPVFVLLKPFYYSWTHLVTECGVIQRVQFVGDVFANEVPEHLTKESIWLQEVGKPLSRPAQELTILLCHDGHLSNKHNMFLKNLWAIHETDPLFTTAVIKVFIYF